jgi:hypothetical protein
MRGLPDQAGERIQANPPSSASLITGSKLGSLAALLTKPIDFVALSTEIDGRVASAT